jgi:hypothetical protein
MTNVPASLPERLADAEGELPEEIVKAIQNLEDASHVYGREGLVEFERGVQRERAALASVIIKHLSILTYTQKFELVQSMRCNPLPPDHPFYAPKPPEDQL